MLAKVACTWNVFPLTMEIMSCASRRKPLMERVCILASRVPGIPAADRVESARLKLARLKISADRKELIEF